MLDIKEIRKDKARIERLVQTKEPSIKLDSVVQLDEQMRHLKTRQETLLHEQKKIEAGGRG